jgi:hypothetical protein
VNGCKDAADFATPDVHHLTQLGYGRSPLRRVRLATPVRTAVYREFKGEWTKSYDRFAIAASRQNIAVT